jgi:hypothetical protein
MVDTPVHRVLVSRGTDCIAERQRGSTDRVTKLAPRPAGPEELSALFEEAMVAY